MTSLLSLQLATRWLNDDLRAQSKRVQAAFNQNQGMQTASSKFLKRVVRGLSEDVQASTKRSVNLRGSWRVIVLVAIGAVMPMLIGNVANAERAKGTETFLSMVSFFLLIAALLVIVVILLRPMTQVVLLPEARAIPEARYHSEIQTLSVDNIVAIFSFFVAFGQVYSIVMSLIPSEEELKGSLPCSIPLDDAGAEMCPKRADTSACMHMVDGTNGRWCQATVNVTGATTWLSNSTTFSAFESHDGLVQCDCGHPSSLANAYAAITPVLERLSLMPLPFEGQDFTLDHARILMFWITVP